MREHRANTNKHAKMLRSYFMQHHLNLIPDFSDIENLFLNLFSTQLTNCQDVGVNQLIQAIDLNVSELIKKIL